MPEKLSPAEIQSRLAKPDSAVDLHKEAINAGVSFSRYLEILNPSQKEDQLDAFERQLQQAGIITRSDPEAGYWASDGKAFFDTAQGRALFPEFFARQWRKVAFARPQERAILLSSDSIVGGYERPYYDSATPYWNNQLVPAIPLSEIVAMTTPITGEDYRALYMTYDAAQLHMFRVGESAEIPRANFATSERTIRLRKYGRALQTSYEQLRRTKVDKIAWWIRFMAIQSEIDKVSSAMATMIAGDGNSGTGATEYNQSSLDSDAVVNELSFEAWIAFRLKFDPPYMMTTALMQVADAIQVIMLNAGTANTPLAGLNLAGIGNSLTPINTTADGIRYGWTAEAPAHKILGFDRRFALEQITEIGSEISETERFISNQTQLLTMTENNAFAVLDPAASKLLDLAE